jgi:hypothetical protein
MEEFLVTPGWMEDWLIELLCLLSIALDFDFLAKFIHRINTVAIWVITSYSLLFQRNMLPPSSAAVLNGGTFTPQEYANPCIWYMQYISYIARHRLKGSKNYILTTKIS